MRNRVKHGTCQRILMEELNLHKVTSKFVSRLLIHDQSANAYTEINSFRSKFDDCPSVASIRLILSHVTVTSFPE